MMPVVDSRTTFRQESTTQHQHCRYDAYCTTSRPRAVNLAECRELRRCPPFFDFIEKDDAKLQVVGVMPAQRLLREEWVSFPMPQVCHGPFEPSFRQIAALSKPIRNSCTGRFFICSAIVNLHISAGFLPDQTASSTFPALGKRPSPTGSRVPAWSAGIRSYNLYYNDQLERHRTGLAPLRIGAQ